MSDSGDVLPPGTRLDDLEIEKVLGVGGFGVTYLARDIALDAWRAVKEYLPPDWGTRRRDGTVGPRTESVVEDYNWGLQRFLEEARILARFDHRNLVRVLRVFEARGTAYIVMEHVDGGTLRAEAREGPLSEARVREVLGALADGLATVHEAGLLHRDIKPGNVMVRGDGTPVLIDFGSARQAMGEHSRSLTAVITPGYAPIEQYSTQGNQGPWTDIYALGALAYWALSGEKPPDATLRVRRDPLVPVAEAARTRVSARLAAAVDQALAVDEPDRPQSLEEWAAVLDGLPPEETAAGNLQVPATGSATAAGPRIAVPATANLPWVPATGSATAAGPPQTRVFDGMQFMWIPEGEFQMGSTSGNADEQPVTSVRISRGFWLGKQEVTQEEWENVMHTNPARFSGCGRCPVENVSWHDAQAFIGRLNGREGGNPYRLPTEAEWEYAARAGTAGDRYRRNLGAIAWYDGNSDRRTHAVGQKLPNSFGLHDMLGNVWEWVQDWYGDYPGAVTDPAGAQSGSYRVRRGGSWIDHARLCRSANRGRNDPGNRDFNLGFRLVRTD